MQRSSETHLQLWLEMSVGINSEGLFGLLEQETIVADKMNGAKGVGSKAKSKKSS